MSVQAGGTIPYHNAAHNTFVAFGTYFGFLGVIAFAALPIGLAISAWKLKQRELFAMIISMIFEWNANIHYQCGYFCLFVY